LRPECASVLLKKKKIDRRDNYRKLKRM
jgi:hypothetical protein